MTAVLGERPRTWRAISRPYRPGIATSTMRTSGLRRSTSETTDRPSAVSPTTSKSGSSSSRHLSASRTTFWSSASTIRVVARLPDALSPFFTVSVRSTLSLGAGGPQEGIRRSTHRVYSYTYRVQASYPRRPLDTCVHESAQSRQKFLSGERPDPRHDADLRVARGWQAFIDSPERRLHDHQWESGSAPNARRHSFRPETRRPPAPTRPHPRHRRSRRHARRPRHAAPHGGLRGHARGGRPGRAREVPPAAGRHRARGHLHAAQERYRHHPGADARLPRLRLHRDVGGRRSPAPQRARVRARGGSAAGPAQADRAVGAAADAGRRGGGPPLAHAAHRDRLRRLTGSGSASPRWGRSSPRRRCPRPSALRPARRGP